ncbi:unnamed protein product, partial [Mesorhabditis spiculigera]
MSQMSAAYCTTSRPTRKQNLGETDRTCQVCFKLMTARRAPSQYMAHVITHLETKSWACTECGLELPSENEIVAHCINDHDGKGQAMAGKDKSFDETVKDMTFRCFPSQSSSLEAYRKILNRGLETAYRDNVNQNTSSEFWSEPVVKQEEPEIPEATETSIPTDLSSLLGLIEDQLPRYEAPVFDAVTAEATLNESLERENRSCHLCGKYISGRSRHSQPSAFMSHIITHVDVKLYACSVCGLELKTEDDVADHCKSKHRGRGKALASSDSLGRQMSEMTTRCFPLHVPLIESYRKKLGWGDERTPLDEIVPTFGMPKRNSDSEPYVYKPRKGKRKTGDLKEGEEMSVFDAIITGNLHVQHAKEKAIRHLLDTTILGVPLDPKPEETAVHQRSMIDAGCDENIEDLFPRESSPPTPEDPEELASEIAKLRALVKKRDAEIKDMDKKLAVEQKSRAELKARNVQLETQMNALATKANQLYKLIGDKSTEIMVLEMKKDDLIGALKKVDPKAAKKFA